MLWTDPFAPLVSQFTRTAAFMPAADVAVSDTDLVLTMDLPGLTADDMSIELLDGHVIVRGERKRPDLGDGVAWAHTERAFGRFERRITVPDGVDPDRIVASMDNGVLSLVVPKPEPRKPRTIAIGSDTEPRELETAAA
jgi:HSP20 family protein